MKKLIAIFLIIAVVVGIGTAAQWGYKKIRQQELSTETTAQELKKIKQKCASPLWRDNKIKTNLEIKTIAAKENHCLKNILIERISLLFQEPELTEMLNTLDNYEKDVLTFYENTYEYNKFCQPKCNPEIIALPEFKWRQDLTDMLQTIISQEKVTK